MTMDENARTERRDVARLLLAASALLAAYDPYVTAPLGHSVCEHCRSKPGDAHEQGCPWGDLYDVVIEMREEQ